MDEVVHVIGGIVDQIGLAVHHGEEQFGPQVAWIMILGFVVSLILARFTPMSYVFLTGHHVLFMATLLTMVLAPAGYSSWVVIIFDAVLLGILMVSPPAIAHPWTRRITGNDSIAIGHFGTAGYLAAGAVGKLVGGKGQKMSASTEELKLPEGLRFLRDSMVATALSMALMYVVLAVLFIARAGTDEAFQAFEGGATGVGDYLMQSVTQGLQFGVYRGDGMSKAFPGEPLPKDLKRLVAHVLFGWRDTVAKDGSWVRHSEDSDKDTSGTVSERKHQSFLSLGLIKILRMQLSKYLNHQNMHSVVVITYVNCTK